ncbi:MAG: plastocyanin [Methanolobus sp.]|jgi:plastocyanin|nr:plastocyanin [Methanolobus sp.]
MRIRSFAFLILFVSLISLVFSGCVDENATDDVSAENVSGQEAVDADTIVYIQEYAFHPDYTTISPGDTVMWVNNDSVAFIIKGTLVGGGSYQSPTLRKGDTFTYTFENKGTYKYELVTHPWTDGGFIVVE